MVYNPRKLSVVINENIGYLIEREKINKQYIYSNLGIMKIVHDPNANVSLEKLEQLADLLNTNVPNLVTDWEKGSYPDEYEMFVKGYKTGYEDCEKGKTFNPKR